MEDKMAKVKFRVGDAVAFDTKGLRQATDRSIRGKQVRHSKQVTLRFPVGEIVEIPKDSFGSWAIVKYLARDNKHHRASLCLDKLTLVRKKGFKGNMKEADDDKD
jgi:hypothetical protein